MNWIQHYLPEEYVLETRLETTQPPISPAFLSEGQPHLNLQRRATWNWTLLPEFHYYAMDARLSAAISKHFAGNKTRIWITMFKEQESELGVEWALADVAVAGMVIEDFAMESLGWECSFDHLFLISEDGTMMASCSDAVIHESDFACNLDLGIPSKKVVWPKWARLFFDRHPSIKWMEDLAGLGGWPDQFLCSDFTFEVLRGFVVDTLQNGNDNEAGRLLETIKLLEEFGECRDWVYFNIYDDLAIEFYKNEPAEWALRLWDFMNPMTLIPDMVRADSFEQMQSMVRSRDAHLIRKHKKRDLGESQSLF